MTRHLLIFAGCFLLGALLMGAIRTARHDAYGVHRGDPVATPATPAGDHPALPLAAPPGPPAAAAPPVNTVCAICGMEVDPRLPTATYQGKTIGFGCKACPPRFAQDPDKYGPAFLNNLVVE
jgi:hypothetical protein